MGQPLLNSLLRNRCSRPYGKEGEVGFEISEITLFNFWKDKDQLKKASFNFKKGLLNSKTFYRDYKFRITKEYFRLQEAFEKIKVVKDKNRVTQNVYNVTLQNKKKGVASDVDLLFAKGELMESKRREKEAKRLYYKRLFLFNFLIGQPLQQDYKLLSKIEYKPLKISLKELLKWIEVAPKLTKAKIDLNHAKLNLRSTWKDLIPYPKIGLSGLRYGHAYGTQSGGTEAQFIGSSSPSNFDLKVSIDLTLPLVGENGLFNKFGVRAAEIKVESAKNKVKKVPGWRLKGK